VKPSPVRFNRLSKMPFSKPHPFCSGCLLVALWFQGKRMTAAISEMRPPDAFEAATDKMIIRGAIEADLPAIVDIYNATVPTRMITAELEPTTVEARLPWFREHSPDQHPF